MGDACGDLRRNIRNMHELLRVLACHKWISENSPADGRHKPNTVKSVYLRRQIAKTQIRPSRKFDGQTERDRMIGDGKIRRGSPVK